MCLIDYKGWLGATAKGGPSSGPLPLLLRQCAAPAHVPMHINLTGTRVACQVHPHITVRSLGPHLHLDGNMNHDIKMRIQALRGGWNTVSTAWRQQIPFKFKSMILR